MKKFDFNDYKDQEVVMRCKTEEEAKEFCRWKHENGEKWTRNISFLEYTFFNDYGTVTCYDVNKSEYGPVSHYVDDGFRILEMSDFWEPGVVKVSDSGVVVRFAEPCVPSLLTMPPFWEPKALTDTTENFVPKNDSVNHPSHYTNGNVECIDAIRASMSHEAFCGYLKGCAMKYLWRYQLKEKPVEDLRKADWYLDKLEKEESKRIE